MRHISVVTVPEKRCSKCGFTKIANEFYKDASSATGLDSCCRECRRQYARNRPKRDTPAVAEKICSHCNEVKPASEFGKNARETTGLQPWCRACHSTYVNRKPKVDAPCVTEKRCSKCGVVKPAVDFCKDKYKPSGLRSWCRECRNKARAATRQERPCVDSQKCRGCGTIKDAGSFPKCKENTSGLKSMCHECGDDRSAALSQESLGSRRKSSAPTSMFSDDGCQTPSSTHTMFWGDRDVPRRRSGRQASVVNAWSPQRGDGNFGTNTPPAAESGRNRRMSRDERFATGSPVIAAAAAAPWDLDDLPFPSFEMGQQKYESNTFHQNEICFERRRKRSRIENRMEEISDCNLNKTDANLAGLYMLVRAAETVSADAFQIKAGSFV